MVLVRFCRHVLACSIIAPFGVSSVSGSLLTRIWWFGDDLEVGLWLQGTKCTLTTTTFLVFDTVSRPSCMTESNTFCDSIWQISDCFLAKHRTLQSLHNDKPRREKKNGLIQCIKEPQGDTLCPKICFVYISKSSVVLKRGTTKEKKKQRKLF